MINIPDTTIENFKEALKKFDIVPSENQLLQFSQYCENLIEWNKVMNLTAITDVDEIYTKHFLDSLSIAAVYSLSDLKDRRIVDIGTGAGFPGLPLAIMIPESEFVLIDSLNKRIKFLEDTIAKLGLKNVTCIHSRAEEAGQNKKFREQFDLCCSRAVANIGVLSEYCMPLLKKSGLFCSYKTEKIAEELVLGKKAISVLGGKVIKTEYFTLPGTDIKRSILVIEKVKETPKKYPRKAGTPVKEPIK